MDTELLVESQIDGGQRLVDQLMRDDFEISVAFWVKTSEEGLWHLDIASPSVDKGKLGEAYRKVYASLGKIPNSWVSPSDIKLVNDMNPIAREAVEVRRPIFCKDSDQVSWKAARRTFDHRGIHLPAAEILFQGFRRDQERISLR